MVDLDGTLCKEICWTPEDCLKATPIREMIDYVNGLFGDAVVIIYTARTDVLMPATLKWLRDNGVRYWGINNTKLPAHEYIDDRAVNADLLLANLREAKTDDRRP